jgi:threonine/homoserine/homoserine lactone efflux protein
MGFIAASAFQWVNAKAWVMAVGMLALYAPQGYGVVGGIAIVVGITLILSIMSCVTWTAFGSALSAWLANRLRLRIFNVTMAALLVATLIPAVLDLWQKYGGRLI